MDITREDLAERFRTMSDEELLSRFGNDLTPLALEVATAELQSRGIEVPSSDGASEESIAVSDTEGGEGVEGGEYAEYDSDTEHPSTLEHDRAVVLVTVAEFWNPIEAQVLRACLESFGIPVHVWGEHLASGNILWSVAGGGTKLQVPREQEAEAREVIAAFQRGELVPSEQSE